MLGPGERHPNGVLNVAGATTYCRTPLPRSCLARRHTRKSRLTEGTSCRRRTRGSSACLSAFLGVLAQCSRTTWQSRISLASDRERGCSVDDLHDPNACSVGALQRSQSLACTFFASLACSSSSHVVSRDWLEFVAVRSGSSSQHFVVRSQLRIPA